VGIEITDLSTLDATRVSDTQTLLAQLLSELYTQVDLRRGVMHDLVLQQHAICLEGVANNNTDRIRQSMSLSAIVADPTLADDELVDSVISNYNVTRIAGTPATGNVTIVVTADQSLVIPQNASFAANGVNFSTPSAHSVRIAGSTRILDTDRVLTDLGTGRYSFSIPVECEVVGAAGAVRRKTRMEPDFEIQNLETSYAEADFSGGKDDETNADLLTRLQEGAAIKSWSSRTSVSALIHAETAFAATGPVSQIGFGDAEMLRDRHSLFPISGGGRVDVYARTAALPLLVELTRAASLIEKTSDGGIWQVTLAADDAPGMYEVARVTLPSDTEDTGSFEITQDTRDFTLGEEDDVNLPDVINALEATYSPYQTVTIQFLDTLTDVTTLDLNTEADYKLVISQMPQLLELQTFLMGRGVCWPAGDVLVKAPIPCFLALNFTIYRKATDNDPDIEPIQLALADYVNSLGFGKKLYASSLADVIYNNLEAGMKVGAIDMDARIRKPDGALLYSRSSSVIAAPNLPDLMTTGRTMAIYLDPQSIGITISAADEPEI
jgi:hypothetical protein